MQGFNGVLIRAALQYGIEPGLGCLARLGDEASDISASDMIHLTEKGSEFLIDAVIDRVLNGPRASTARAVN